MLLSLEIRVPAVGYLWSQSSRGVFVVPKFTLHGSGAVVDAKINVGWMLLHTFYDTHDDYCVQFSPIDFILIIFHGCRVKLLNADREERLAVTRSLQRDFSRFSIHFSLYPKQNVQKGGLSLIPSSRRVYCPSHPYRPWIRLHNPQS